jgi:hypothetical protein
LKNLFITPFKEISKTTSKDKAIEMFKLSANLAIAKLSDPVLQDHILAHDDLLVYFDNLISDYAKIHFGI